MDVAARAKLDARQMRTVAAIGATTRSTARGSVNVDALLDRLDANDDHRFRNRRAGDRVRYRKTDVPVKISHPGGSTSTALVITRNISVSGVGVLLDRFLHNGTRVQLVLRRSMDDVPDVLPGKVVFCTHVSGAIHQAGVRFDEKIFPALYVVADGSVN